MDSKETTLLTAIIITAIIIGGIIIYFFLSLLRQHRGNQELYKSKLRAEIDTLEKERSRLAADLHDELGPLLSSAKLKMNCIEVQSEEDQHQLEKVNTHIDEIMRRMREISNDLLPNTLIRKGLVAAIEGSIENLKSQNKLAILFQPIVKLSIDQDKSIHIYRIIQEVIHNTVKHANASSLNIKLEQKKDKLVLQTDDNGIGYQQDNAVRNTSGLGLRNLLSRTELLRGQMFVETAEGKGTHYTFEFPT